MRRKVLSVLLCGAMAATMLTGCGGSTSDTGNNAAGSGDATSVSSADSTPVPTNAISGDADAADAFVVWGWNEDVKKILDGPFKEDHPDEYNRIVFVNTGGSDYYQTKIDEMLDDTENKLYPDLMALEVDYVLKYVNSDYLMSVADLGIQESDYANQYKYNLDLGTDASGNVKALFWQATPGSWQLRADLCKKYLGTTDAKKLQDKYFSSWDKIVKAAEKINKKSEGKCKLLSGYTDIFRIFSNSRSNGWYDDNDVITVDDNMKQYMEVAKKMYDGELTYNTEQWSTDWYANMAGDGKDSSAALAYTGCPWFTYWCLNADTWTGQTILVAGPQQFFWGGSGLAATAGCADKDLAGTIIKYFTCETESMVKINALNSDYVNNTEAIAQISKAGVKCDFIYKDQDIMAFYLPLADSIDASIVTGEDQDINSMWDSQVKEYVAGNVDEDGAIAAFKSLTHDKFDYLKVE